MPAKTKDHPDLVGTYEVPEHPDLERGRRVRKPRTRIKSRTTVRTLKLAREPDPTGDEEGLGLVQVSIERSTNNQGKLGAEGRFETTSYYLDKGFVIPTGIPLGAFNTSIQRALRESWGWELEPEDEIDALFCANRDCWGPSVSEETGSPLCVECALLWANGLIRWD